MKQEWKARALLMTNWSIVGTGDAYTPPECRLMRLNGDVTGHKVFGDSNVTSSPIVEIDGQYMRTLSGNIYRLDINPHEEYCKAFPEKVDRLRSETPLTINDVSTYAFPCYGNDSTLSNAYPLEWLHKLGYNPKDPDTGEYYPIKTLEKSEEHGNEENAI